MPSDPKTAALLERAKANGGLGPYLDTAEGRAELVECLSTGERRAELEGYLEEARAQLRAGTEEARWVTVLDEYSRTRKGRDVLDDALQQAIDRGQPSLGAAIRGDTAFYARAMLNEVGAPTGLHFLSTFWHLCWDTDAFFCLALYRVRVALLVRRIPLVPTFLHRVCVMLAQVNIGKGVVMDPGVILLHGQVVMDGAVRIGTGTVIAPWVTLGRRGHRVDGPAVGTNALIGTGAKLLGAINIGDQAHIGANAVVLTDVEPYGIAVGAPAKVVRSRLDDPDVVEMREAIAKEMRAHRAKEKASE